MINKVYLKIKKIMKENYKSLIVLIIAYFIFTFPLPYYIYAGGGTININERIMIDNKKNNSKGSLNFAYVKELKGNVATCLLGLLIPSYEIVKEDEISLDKQETSEDIYFRNQIYLENANQTAILLAYNKANKKITIKDEHFYVVYNIYNKENSLKVGDELLEINNQKITSIEEFQKKINTYNSNDLVNLTILRNNKKKKIKAKVRTKNNNKYLGISIISIYSFETNPPIKLNFKETEGGPSGGLMLTLAIYDKLKNSNLANNRKIVGTGTIDINGNVGEIGGVKYKLKGAVKNKADIFLVPKGNNYKEALKEKEKHNYKIKIKAVKTLDEAINYLEEEDNE